MIISNLKSVTRSINSPVLPLQVSFFNPPSLRRVSFASIQKPLNDAVKKAAEKQCRI
jgi:hypothetical protein